MKRKTILILSMVMVTLSIFGVDMAIKVGDAENDKEIVLGLASKVFIEKSKKLGEDKVSESEVIQKTFLDTEFWMIAIAEGARRGLLRPTDQAMWTEAQKLREESDYASVDPHAFNLQVKAVLVARTLLASDGIVVPTSLTELRDIVISRYSQNHEIELADYSGWHVDKRHGSLIKDSDYNAIEQELSKDSGVFMKAIYYAHHYTVRYYVQFIRWYMSKAQELAGRFKEDESEKVAKWARIILLYVIPFLFHVIVVVVFCKIMDYNVGPCILLLTPLFYGISTLLYFFGMSPYSLFTAVVVIPLSVCFAVSFVGKIADDDYKRSKLGPLYEFDHWGHRSPVGKVYTRSGELVDDPGCGVEKKRWNDPYGEDLE